jgi:hypothetical protein
MTPSTPQLIQSHVASFACGYTSKMPVPPLLLSLPHRGSRTQPGVSSLSSAVYPAPKGHQFKTGASTDRSMPKKPLCLRELRGLRASISSSGLLRAPTTEVLSFRVAHFCLTMKVAAQSRSTREAPAQAELRPTCAGASNS